MHRRQVLEIVSRLAHHQHGLFTRAQADAAGITDGELERLRDDLERLGYGVWRFRWSPTSPDEGIAAALLAIVPGVPLWEHIGSPTIAVSHLSAASMFGLGNLPARRHELTTTTKRRTRRPEIRLHKRVLPDGDIVEHHGLPVTNPTRTLLDVITDRRADPPHLGDMVADAITKQLVDANSLDERLRDAAASYRVADLLTDAGRASILTPR